MVKGMLKSVDHFFLTVMLLFNFIVFLSFVGSSRNKDLFQAYIYFKQHDHCTDN